MSALPPPANAEREAFPETEFRAWLGEEATPVVISQSRERYHAFCVEFGIAGSGKTKEEALDDAVNLLMRYLVFSFSEGRSYRKSKKSPPVRLRLRSWYLFARTKLLRGVKPLSRLGWLTSVPTTGRDSHRLAH